MNPIIQVEHFSKKYGDFTAVDDISFTVDAGSIFAFLGPNGAGKSTTINTLCTILDKTEGTLKINGHDVDKERSLEGWYTILRFYFWTNPPQVLIRRPEPMCGNISSGFKSRKI